MHSKNYRVLLFCAASLAAIAIGHPRVGADEEENNSPRIEQKHRTGEFFVEVPGAPAKAWLETAYQYGEKISQKDLGRVKRGELDWFWAFDSEGPYQYRVNVPDTYDPAIPHGILVFIDNGGNGDVSRRYKELLAKHNLIFIAAMKAGNGSGRNFRQVLAVYAVDLLRDAYNIDEDRIYLSGRSGGGRVTSTAMIMEAETFDGGIPLIGANPVIPMRYFKSEGDAFQADGAWARPSRKILRHAARNGRYALISGEKDYNNKGMRAVAEGLKKRGFRYVTYLEEPGLGHNTPSAEWFEKGIKFLDAPLREAAVDHYERAVRMDERDMLGDAMQSYEKAAAHGGDADWTAKAAERVAALKEQYDRDVEAVEKAIADLDKAAYLTSLRDLRSKWRDAARDDIKNLIERYAQARRDAATSE